MYQSITLLGHLGNDPESRFTASGTMVTAFRMATSQQWTSASGERQEKVVWWRISIWGEKQGEPVAKYLHKGSKVMVIGEVEPPTVYVNKVGEHAATLEVKAQTVRFLDSRGDGEQSAPRTQPASKPANDDKNIPF